LLVKAIHIKCQDSHKLDRKTKLLKSLAGAFPRIYRAPFSKGFFFCCGEHG